MSALFTKLYIAQRTITAVPSITIHGVAPLTEMEIEEEKAAKLALAASFGIFGAVDEPSDQVIYEIADSNDNQIDCLM